MVTGVICATLGVGLPASAAAATAPQPVSARAALLASLPSPGTTGSGVTALQQALIARGFAIPAGATGYFGSQTRAAVAAFQRAQGWRGSGADGIPGPLTMARLGLTGPGTPPAAPAPAAPAPAAPAGPAVPGSSGPAVTALQQALVARGLPVSGDAAGFYGPATRSAVAAFQRAQGWRGSGADGVPGPLTLARLGLTATAARPAPASAPQPAPGISAPATPALALPPAAFVSHYGAVARRVSQATGVPALVNLAQAALESGWGASAPGYNFFGIKARPDDPAGTSQARITIETLPTPNSKVFPDVVSVTQRPDGRYDYAVRQWFRVYASPEDAFMDHGKVLASRSWYRPAFQHTDDPYAFAAAVAAGGYATDPAYVTKLHRVMRLIESLGVPAGGG